MIEKQQLQKHYAEYATRSDERVRDREAAKLSIVRQVLSAFPLEAHGEPTIVVLGTSDKRYLDVHRRVFADALGKPVNVSTFDIDTEHLGNESDVVHHDATTPFPGGPYAIVFSHELMKFLTSDEQLHVLRNSYEALAPGGVAMHVMHEASIKGTDKLESWQNRVDPDALVQKLTAENIPGHKMVFDSVTSVDWMRETTVIVLKKEKQV